MSGSDSSGETECRVSKKTRLLPPTYVDQLKCEADNNASIIINNVKKCLAINDALGVVHWCKRIRNFFEQKYKFDVAERKELVMLLWAFFPKVDDLKQQTVIGRSLTGLLRKRRKHSPGVLDPAPILKVVVEHHFLKLRQTEYTGSGAKYYHGDMLRKLVEASRRYFPEDTFERILREFGPRMCPHDRACDRSQLLFTSFCQSTFNNERLEIVMKLWRFKENHSDWDCRWLSLLARAAKHNVFHAEGENIIEWKPFLPDIMTHFLRIMKIGVSGSVAKPAVSTQSMECVMFDPHLPSPATFLPKLWLYMMKGCDESSATSMSPFDYFVDVFTKIKPLFHPSNSRDRNVKVLTVMVCNFASSLAKRLALVEKRKLRPEWRLSAVQVDRMVSILFDACMLLLFSKSNYGDVALAIKHLAATRPTLVMKPLVDNLFDGLETLTAAHRTSPSIRAIAFACSPLINSSLSGVLKGEESFFVHLPRILQLTLPGIDANDLRKTRNTLCLYGAIFHLLPIRGLRDGNQTSPEALVPLASVLPDWASLCIDRVLALTRETDDIALMQSLELFLDSFFRSMSDDVHEIVCTRIARFMKDNFVEKSQRQRRIASYAVFCNPSAGWKIFSQLHDFDGLAAELPTMSIDRATRCLQIVGAACAGLDHQEILDHLPLLENIISVTEKANAKRKEVFNEGLHLLDVVFSVFLSMRVQYQRHLKQPWPAGEVLEPVDDVELVWTFPSPAAVAAARSWLKEKITKLETHMSDIEAKEDDGKDGNGLKAKNHIRRQLATISKLVVTCSRLLYSGAHKDESNNYESDEEEDGLDKKYQRHFPREFLSETVGPPLLPPEEANRLRESLGELLHRHAVFVRATLKDDVQTLSELGEAIGAFFRHYPQSFRAFYKSVLSDWRDLTAIQSPTKKCSGIMWQGWARLHHETRLGHAQRTLPRTGISLKLLDDLYELATGEYANARAAAQKALIPTIPLFRKQFNQLVLRVIAALSDPQASEENVTGNCYFLLDSRIISRISRQWRFLAPLMRSLVNSNIHQKPTVQNRLYFVFVYVVAACYALPVPSAQPCSDGYSLADVAGVDVSEEAKKIAMERFDTYAKKDRRRYFECIDNLLEKLNEHQAAGHWRYLVMNFTCIVLLLRKRIPMKDEAFKKMLLGCADDLAPIRKICMTGSMWMITAHHRLQQEDHPLSYSSSSGHQWEEWAAHVGVSYPNVGGCAPLLSTASSSPQEPIPADALARVKSLHEIHHSFVADSQWLKKMFSLVSDDHRLPEEGESSNTGSRMNVLRQLVGHGGGSLFDQADIAKQAAQEILSEIAKLPRSFPTSTRRWSSEFDIFNATFFQCLFQLQDVTSATPWTAMRSLVETVVENNFKPLCSSSARRDQLTAAEISCGIVRASKRMDRDVFASITTMIGPLLLASVEGSAQDVGLDWASSLRMMCYHRNAQECMWILKLFFNNPMASSSSTVQVNRLTAIDAITEQMSWKLSSVSMKDVSEEMTDQTVPEYLASLSASCFNHPYQLIRRLACSLFTSLAISTWKPLGVSKDATAAPAFVTAANAVASVFTSLTEACTVQFGTQEVAQFRDDVEGPVKKRTRERECMLCALVLFSQTGWTNVVIPHVKAILSSLMASVTDPDTEVTKYAKYLGPVIAQSYLPRNSAAEVLDIAMNSARSKDSWREREFAVAFLQIFVFVHQYLLSPEQMRGAERLIMTRLKDAQVEVRLTAAECLLSFLRGAKREYVDKCIKLNASAGGNSRDVRKLVKAKAHGNEKEEADNLILQRHGGILGMGALVKLFPYSVPEWLPPVMVRLADHAGDPEPLGKTVRAIMQEFWRTHSDAWPTMKYTWFSSDELAVLNDLLISPSYYA